MYTTFPSGTIVKQVDHRKLFLLFSGIFQNVIGSHARKKCVVLKIWVQSARASAGYTKKNDFVDYTPNSPRVTFPNAD